MKNCILIFSFFFFTLFTCSSFAGTGTTTLATYYPAPVAAYNTVVLSPTATVAGIQTNAYCTGGNNGAIYRDYTQTFFQCSGSGLATKLSTIVPAGTVISDNTGTVHVMQHNNDAIYPQECYNTLCSSSQTLSGCGWDGLSTYTTYQSSTVNNQGIGAQGGVAGTICASGFVQIGVDQTGPPPDAYDIFQITTNSTTVISVVCCSGISDIFGNPDD